MGIFWVIDGLLYREVPRTGEQPDAFLTNQLECVGSRPYQADLRDSAEEIEFTPPPDSRPVPAPVDLPVRDLPEEKRRPSYILPFGNSEVIILPPQRRETREVEGTPSIVVAPAAPSQDDSRRASAGLGLIPVAQVMSTRLVTISPETTGARAHQVMEDHGFHHLLVVDPEGRLSGIISDRDLLRHPEAPTVGEFMCRRFLAANPAADLREAAWAMLKERFSCLPVLEYDGTPQGILTVTDVLTYLVEHPAFRLWA